MKKKISEFPASFFKSERERKKILSDPELVKGLEDMEWEPMSEEYWEWRKQR